jgi:TolA-binding protein
MVSALHLLSALLLAAPPVTNPRPELAAAAVAPKTAAAALAPKPAAAAVAPKPAAAATTPKPAVPLALPGAPSPPRSAKPAAEKASPAPATLAELLSSTPADSLAKPLRRFEAENSRTQLGAEAAFTLGQFHFARGEYRQAGDAYARAAARFPPGRKPEARYWQGLSELGQGDAVQARAALEEVAQGASGRRSEARFALAEAWDKAGRPDRAADELKALLEEGPGAMTAPALERLATLQLRLGDTDAAKRTEAQLRSSHPASIEAARAPVPAAKPLPVAAAGRSERGRIGVQIGAFADPDRARGLQQSARLAGFDKAATLRQGQGGAALHVVRIGWYPTEAEARAAGERASRELGVAYRLIRSP